MPKFIHTDAYVRGYNDFMRSVVYRKPEPANPFKWYVAQREWNHGRDIAKQDHQAGKIQYYSNNTTLTEYTPVTQ